MTLSKSQYIRGLQCHKSLWLYKNRPELRDTPDDAKESLFNTGHSVGELSKNLFPNGVDTEFITVPLKKYEDIFGELPPLNRSM